MMNIIDRLEKEHMRLDIPSFRPGDTVKVYLKIKEGDKERIQVFQGIVISKRKGGLRSSFTVRKISKTGTGVEKIIPLLSPYIAKMKLVKKSSYQKAKLYFIRDLTEQEVRTKLYQVKKKNTHEPLSEKSR